MLNKKRTLQFIGAALLASSMAFTAYASNAFYDETYTGNKIIAGEGIPSGTYCLLRSSETKQGSYSIKSGSYKLINDTFGYNAIIYLEPDDVLYMENCYAVPIDDARINIANEFMGEVGTHISAGDYEVHFLRDSSQTGLCTIYDTIDFHFYEDKDDTAEDHSKETKISNGSEGTQIKLEEGQYVKLDGCYLTGIDEDEDD